MMKRNNVKSALFILVMALMAMPVYSQAPEGRGQGQGQGQRRQMSEEDIKERVADLSKTLELNKEQEKKILDAELDFFKTMQKEREGFDPRTGDREAMRSKMMELREERDAKYKEILSEEQFAKYQKMVEERRSRMRQQRPGQGEGAPAERGRGRGRGGA